MSKLFSFVQSIDEDLFSKCKATEQITKTKPTTAASNLRLACERFLKFLFIYNNLSTFRKNGFSKTINDMINEAYGNKLINTVQKKTLHNVREFGNKFHHTNNPKHDLKNKQKVEKADMNELISHFKQFHKTLITCFKYYNLTTERIFFDEDSMMIEDYLPIKTLNIEDYEEGCEKKYFCKRVDHETGMETYYVIRQFKKPQSYSKKDNEFITRDLRTLQLSWEEEMSNVVKYHNISTEQDNELFFTCYELSQEDANLTELKFKELLLAERLELIKGIAKGIFELHNANEPIYHRALTPSSIYVRKKRNGKRLAKIGNFEYAKLTANNVGTVYSKVTKRKEDPFRPLELTNPEGRIDWSKVDIYSFGKIILFFFNLADQYDITKIRKTLSQLKLSNQFINTIEAMVDQVPEERPEIKTVLEVVNQEEKKVKEVKQDE